MGEENLHQSDGGVVVFDFETSGMSPEQGDRAIEIGAVRLVGDRIVDRFQSLMNPGRFINSFIEDLTGISNAMVQEAPPAAEIMSQFFHFIGDSPLVAHNAAFDRRFLDAELALIGLRRRQEMACSLLVARRLYPEAPNHKLQTLVHYHDLPHKGTFHRALADAEMTAHLWRQMGYDIASTYGCGSVPFMILQGLSKVSKKQVDAYLRRYAADLGAKSR
ncbi:PolC-type DNA polymerase III [Syntrophotalea acetylenivorans]|nr:3'-5' exonuclease [Syntrophotalea acetylenivorans]